MGTPIIKALVCFSISFFATAILIPYINKFSFKFNIIDYPDHRKQHTKKIARLGGLGIFLGVFLSVIYILINDLFYYESFLIFNFLIIIPALFFFLGFIDDVLNLSPFLRLFIQFFISVLVWASGMQIKGFEFSFFNLGAYNINLSSGLSLFFTVFWITGFINALNWIDGLDGLATGMTLISSTGLIFYACNTGNIEYIYLLLSIIGSGLGFLIHNSYPAKILMGDGGSYFFGSFLSVLSIPLFSSKKDLLLNNQENITTSIIPLFLLFAIPITDMVMVIFSRIYNNKSIFNPDRSHFHHRILEKGFSHKNTVILLCALSQFLVMISILSIVKEYRFLIFLISLSILLIVCIKKTDLKALFKLNFLPKKN